MRKQGENPAQTPAQLPPEHQADFIHWAYGLFAIPATHDDEGREVYVTPYPGCYGQAGYILTVNGSPSRATVCIEPASGTMVAMRSGRIVRGEEYHPTKSIVRRYREAVAWLERLGLDVPSRGM